MNLNQYVEAALQTESRIDSVSLDVGTTVPLLETFVAAGNLIDVVKKDTFYGLPTTPEKIQARLERIEQNTVALPHAAVQYSNTPAGPQKTLEQLDPRVVHAVIGLATESVELIEALLESIKSSNPIDRVNLLEELGDINWYHAILIDALNGDWAKVQETNIAKLQARNKGKAFNAEATINRDVAAERAILESGAK